MKEQAEKPGGPTKRGRGRPASDVKRPMVSFRVDPDVLAAFKATGRGWQTRMHNLIREAVEQGRV